MFTAEMLMSIDTGAESRRSMEGARDVEGKRGEEGCRGPKSRGEVPGRDGMTGGGSALMGRS